MPKSLDSAQIRTRLLETSARALAITSRSCPIDRVLARAGHLDVVMARSGALIDQALRLRYQVFSQEFGDSYANFRGFDDDEFDDHCQHLVVRDGIMGAVVGTYRMLPPRAAHKLGRYACEAEFDLTPLDPIRHELVELGRACVDPRYRSGATIMLLWSAIGQYLMRGSYRYLIGCSSVSMADGGKAASSLYQTLSFNGQRHDTWRVTPRRPVRMDCSVSNQKVRTPPLFKGYLKAGGRLIGDPHHVPRFGVADFPIMLELDQATARYEKRAQAAVGVHQINATSRLTGTV